MKKNILLWLMVLSLNLWGCTEDELTTVVKAYTLENGTTNITDVPQGFYTIREVRTPDGYICHEKEAKLAVDYNYFNTYLFILPSDTEVLNH